MSSVRGGRGSGGSQRKSSTCSFCGKGQSATMEEGVRLPPTGSRREHLLPIQDGHRRPAARTRCERASYRSPTRLQCPEPHVRTRKTDVGRDSQLNPARKPTVRPVTDSCTNAQRRRDVPRPVLAVGNQTVVPEKLRGLGPCLASRQDRERQDGRCKSRHDRPPLD